VDDLARLGVDLRVVLPGLQVCQDLERRAGQLGAEQQRLQARDDRVPAEDAHEPGHAGAGELADAGVAGAHSQRREVGDGLDEAARQVLPARAQLRYAQLPRGQRVAHTADLLAEAPLCEARRHRLAVREREHVDVELPALARLERDAVADQAVRRLPALREDDLGRVHEVRVDVLDQELIALVVEGAAQPRRQRVGAERVAEREVVVLDREDVGEVGADLHCEVELDRLHALVDHEDRVLHPLADEALTPDREGVLRKAVAGPVAHEERGGEVLDFVRCEQQRPLAVDRQLQAGEEPRVVCEQALDVAVQVADLVADAERRALEDPELLRHRAGSSHRSTGRAPSRRSRPRSRAAVA
jgi:hypothetical protein